MLTGLIRLLTLPLMLGSIALVGGLVSPARGHSFTTVLIVPPDTPDAARSEIVAAFLLAADERDGHADEESDGHLGGLDVYLVPVRAGELADIANAAPDVIAALLPVEAGLDDVAQATGAVMVGPLDPDGATAGAFLRGAAGNELAPFAKRFVAEMGKAPGDGAIASYLVARRIDEAIRELGGVDDRERLRALLSQ
ncbi:hypothetical protein VSX64_00270 [Aurantimonas sp. C2-6-R+9]|uniref:hypothetical protein n=1 Tax=unclassified Aurantimonas TaxID=2638230 RepID=UPI002E16F4F2|nr:MULTISPECIES: hypothetical protein [unclassified Aurantimonas]MEC5289097.1 hypothetical protein [Aurantimonas sp. C2-3-R2]MEC5379328.1 hypothetical protein [Aurantimonas sp. C2-6-R+9]MEC5410081.1 hypothetical protein [Aurantimonas sp. C2-4-R8]